jgi:hypothetical protein
MGLGDINIGEASAVAAANTAGEATVLHAGSASEAALLLLELQLSCSMGYR